jgi:hypothetical protein
VPRTTYEEKLREQCDFLKSSVASFQQGQSGEALRIATTVRVLVHETGSSKPLLKQLNPNYLQITIKDSPPPGPVNPGGMVLFYIGVGVQMDGGGRVTPLTGGKPNEQLVPLGSWWNQTILIFSESNERIVFTRKSLLLTLANKEGGAHVDTSLPAAYEKFVVGSPLRLIANGIQTDTVNLARFCAVESGLEMIECLERNFPSAFK